MLMTIPYSYTTGHGSGWGNIGSMYNRGFEVSVQYELFNTKDFYWSIAGNSTTTRTRSRNSSADAVNMCCLIQV